jgi:tyrosine-protein phosphatase YwqE
VIDLHSHLLPGVDDGARTVAQSVVTLQALA